VRKSFYGAGILAAVAMGIASPGMGEGPPSPPPPRKRPKPDEHKHSREIARRLRQQARQDAKRKT
jgi:hypothetical protein